MSSLWRPEVADIDLCHAKRGRAVGIAWRQLDRAAVKPKGFLMAPLDKRDASLAVQNGTGFTYQVLRRRRAVFASSTDTAGSGVWRNRASSQWVCASPQWLALVRIVMDRPFEEAPRLEIVGFVISGSAAWLCRKASQACKLRVPSAVRAVSPLVKLT
jgi:hypothetical protein